MVTIEARPGAALRLGYAGEHLARRIMFPTSGLCGLHGCGTATVIATRADDTEGYLVPAEEGVGCVYWNLRRVDVANVGAGECELRWTVGDEVVYKELWITEVEEPIDPPGEWPELNEPGETPEDPAAGYLETVAAAGASARESARQAKSYAASAAASAAKAEKVAETAKGIADLRVSAEGVSADTPASVTKEVVDGVLTMTFQIPAGQPGPQGEKGKTGEQGVPGEQGPRGEQGPQGDKGEKGDTGDAGPQGPQGAQGAAGPQGEKGDKGEKGDTGDTGPQGPKGDSYVLTSADKDEIAAAVLDALPVYNGEVTAV